MRTLFATWGMLIASAFALPLMAQWTGERSGVSVTGAAGVVETSQAIAAYDEAHPFTGNIRIRAELDARNKFKRPSALSLPGNRFPYDGTDEDRAILLNTTQSIHSNFLGIQVNESGSVPPDCMGDVSPTQICVAANGRIKWYAKPTVCDAPLTTSPNTATPSLGNPVFSVALRSFFNTVLAGADITDPHVRYDRLSNRWFVVAISTANASNRVVIAVSNSGTITNQSSFTFFQFTHDTGAANNSPDRGAFFDFPMLGVDRHALYIGGLIFNSSGNYSGATVFVVNKQSVLGAGPIQFTAFRQVGLANSGIFAPQGVNNDDPNAVRGFFVGADAAVFGRLQYIVVQNPGGTPTISNATVNVPATFFPYEQAAQGSTKPLDAADDRLLSAIMMRNKVTGQSSIWTAHNIAVNNTGTAVNDFNLSVARNAVRWYQLVDNNGVLSLGQAGTLFDNTLSGPRGYWMGSIMGTGQGHAVLGATEASGTLPANSVVAGRYATQAPGTLNPVVAATQASFAYNLEDDEDVQRWGDYSQTVVDPADDMTLWTFQQYTNNTNSWGVRAIQLRAPPPATPVSLSPIICDNQRRATVTLTGQSTDFSGFFDPGDGAGGPAFARRLQVSSTGGVTVSNVQFNSPTEIRFTLAFGNAAPGSQQTLTITNPDCQSVTFNYTLPATCGGGVDPDPDPGGPVRFLVLQPNPASDQFVARVPADIGELRIYSVDGKLLEIIPVTGLAVSVNARRYPRGIYLVEYTDGSRRQTQKLVLY